MPSMLRLERAVCGSRSAVSVNVMRIRHVGMRMCQWFMPVSVAVLPSGHGLVIVRVVSVVMTVRVFVLQCVVGVLVTVGLRQVQHHAGQHQCATQRH
mgnify:CR=1 FL=1